MDELLSPVLPIGDTGLTPDRTGFAAAPLPTNDRLINSAASAGFAPADLPEVTSATLDSVAIQDPTLRSQTVDPTDKTIAAEKAIDPLLGTSAAQTLETQPAARAAHQILTKLYPTLTSTLDAQLVKSLGRVADGQAENDGVAFGRLVADKLLASRIGDGSNEIVPYTPGTKPGEWQPTAPANAAALLPGWGKVKTFGIETGSQFRPDGPPSLTSDKYATDYNLTKDLGALNSTTRTLDQSEIAIFWADGAGTYTPPGHWNQIAEQESDRRNLSIIDTARLFASLNVAMADAAIVAWDAKYTYNFWRPITAIQKGETDGNDKTIGDPNWQPLITTPPFPEYTSGHSTFSGAAATVMTDFFGKNYSFKSSSIGLPGIERRYDNFQQAADEAGISRIYGGIHFLSANEDGLASGRKVGAYVTDKLFKPA